MDAFVARCRKAGLAVTPQRLAIFRRLAATDRHPSAEELHAAVRREMPTLSLATVYKTLDALAGIGAVRPVSRLGARGRWDANLEPHHHLVCTSCGTVTLPSWWPHCFSSETWFSIWSAQAPASIIFLASR